MNKCDVVFEQFCTYKIANGQTNTTIKYIAMHRLVVSLNLKLHEGFKNGNFLSSVVPGLMAPEKHDWIAFSNINNFCGDVVTI